MAPITDQKLDCTVNEKAHIPAYFLCLFFGPFGVHRFYLGRHTSAFLMLTTLGGFGIWYYIDLARLDNGTLLDKYGLPLQRYL
jgi:TM2 domain-containing membrane protein YozV